MFPIEKDDIHCPDCGQILCPLEIQNFCEKCGWRLSRGVMLRLHIQFDHPTRRARDKVKKLNQLSERKALLEFITNMDHRKSAHGCHIQLLARTITISVIEFLCGDTNSFRKCSKFCTICGEKLPTFAKLTRKDQDLIIDLIQNFLKHTSTSKDFRSLIIGTIRQIE